MPCPQCGYMIPRDMPCPRCAGVQSDSSRQAALPPLQMQQRAQPPSLLVFGLCLVGVGVFFFGFLQLRQWSIDSRNARGQALYDRFSVGQNGRIPGANPSTQFDAENRQMRTDSQNELRLMQQQNAQRLQQLQQQNEAQMRSLPIGFGAR